MTAPLAAGVAAAAGEAAPAVREAARETPIAGTCDVLVCGGGPAGVAAAVSAARAGAGVRLLELHGCLGGVWTSGMLSFVIDADKPGLNREITRRLDAEDARLDRRGKSLAWQSYQFDAEAMKYVLETLVDSLGIEVQLHTRVVAVEKDGREVRGVVTESKSGRQAWRAKAVIDATGDGDVAALAGCRYEIGDGAGSKGTGVADCPCQPMSLMGIISGPPETLAKYAADAAAGNKDRFRDALHAAGHEPSYAKPTVWHMPGSPVAALMMNHAYGVRPDDAAAVTRATLRSRREVYKAVRSLKSIPEWTGVRMVATAEQIGVRDGRRVQGRETVTAEDVVAGQRRPDGICTSAFCVDVHAVTKDAAAYGNRGVKAKPFNIPLASLLPADADGLLTAGRCVSGDFIAHASYRVTGNAVAMGEAAGVAAALSAKTGTPPHAVEPADVLAGLKRVRGSS